MDHYVGVLKGVISRICPQARTIDISHEVEPFRIAQGGYLLSQAWPWFPAATVHVAVVDPGVGSARRTIAAQANGHVFVLPDNGLLSQLSLEIPIVREIRNEAVMLLPVSRTFHGRDIFAPAAAHLASGFPFTELGPLIEDWVSLPRGSKRVLHIDRFGNVITGLRAADYNLRELPQWNLQVGTTGVRRFGESYAAVPKGELFAIEGSGGYLEISAREGSAAALMNCHIGDPVTLQFDDKS